MLYTGENYDHVGYLSHGIRTYCCGYGKDHTSSWVLDLISNLNGNAYHIDKPGHDNIHTNSNGHVEQLCIMQESTHAVFYYAHDKHIARTLMLMGYAIMCPHVTIVVFMDGLKGSAAKLVTSVARNNNIAICTTLKQVLKYLTTSWQNKEVKHILLEREVMV